MRNTFLLLAGFVLIACTEKFVPAENNPYVPPQGRCVFRAEVSPISGAWVWDAAHDRAGVYGSNVSNAMFCPRAAFDGASGAAELIGEGVTGDAFAYIPYRPEGVDALASGCVPLPAEQRYFRDAASQIEGNELLVARADEDGLLRFSHRCGALHIRLKINLGENVQSVSLSANEPLCGWFDISGGGEVLHASRSVRVTGMDSPCSESAPLDVWVMLPEGTYTGLFVTVAGSTESISTIIEGRFEIAACRETSVSASEQKNHYGGSEFEAEEVQYD